MPSTDSCSSCCDTAVPTQVPGAEGEAGVDGTDGINAFTTLTAPLTVPAIGANVTASVAESSWAAYGQFVVIGDASSTTGGATFEVVGIPTATSLTLTFKGYPSDVAAATVMPTGSTVSPAGEWGLPTPLKVYAAGTAYAFTNTAALLDFGTTDPSLTITVPGTYLLFARVRVDYTGATFAAVRDVVLKIRRTNNTAADVTNATTTAKTDIITTLTYTMGIFCLPVVTYTTSNTNDILQIWGSVSTVPSAGTLDAVEAELVALRIF